MELTNSRDAQFIEEDYGNGEPTGGIMLRVKQYWHQTSWWTLIPFLIILIIDIGTSIIIPYYMRRVNPDTRDLLECSRESGYVLFSNCCLNPDGSCFEPGDLEHKMSLVSMVNYGLSVVLSLVLLGVQVYNQDDISNKSFFKVDLVSFVFTIRNFTMFNMMNYTSGRVGQLVVVSVVKMELDTMIFIGVSSLLMSILVYISFPTHRVFNVPVLPLWLKSLVFLAWLILISSIIYYIGATNVLGKNVLSLYDIRGPELLTLNYWNYGILLIIYSEYVLFTEVVLSWRSISV
jgi:hypothetical protein